MAYQKKTASVSLTSDIGFHDADAKMLWALVNDGLRRGEEVVARIKGIGTNLDMRTLLRVGGDKNNPLFGVGPDTKLALQLALEVEILVPVPDVKVEEKSEEKVGSDMPAAWEDSSQR